MLLPVLAQVTQLLAPALLAAGGDSTGWSLRPMRGVPMPEWIVSADTSGARVAVSGTGTAGWAMLPLATPVTVPVRMQWSWRCLVHPAMASLVERRRDDAPLRVIVGFGGRAGAPARAIAYTWGNLEAMGTRRRSHQGDRIHIVVVATAREADSTWMTVVVNPMADYRAIWPTRNEPITGVALVQDVDDTGAHAAAEIRDLTIAPITPEPR